MTREPVNGSPEAALACAVIRTAILDSRGRVICPTPRGPTRQQTMEDARQFLAPGSTGLEFWADVAGLDPEALAQAIKTNGQQFSAEYRARDVRR